VNFIDSKLYGLVEKFANLLILNALWLICSLPILTIGPATSAMLSVVRQWKLHEDTSSVRNFFHYFKENFRYSFIIGLFFLGYSVILFFNLFYLNQDQSGIKIIMLIPLLVITFFILCLSAYIFPIISHYKLSFKKTIHNAFFMSIYYFPTTILLFLIFFLLAMLVKYVPILLLVIFSSGGLIQFSLCYRVFEKIGASYEEVTI